MGCRTIAIGLVLGIATTLFAENPIITQRRNADPAPRVWNGRVYLYCSHDQPDATSFWSMDNYYVYSSVDLVHWTDHGEVLNSSQLPNQWAGVGGLWAPDCMYRNATYYFYFPCLNGTRGTGVATSPNPEGPFVDALGHKMTDGEIDPYIFKDDDGEYYFIQGGLQGATTIARLNPDMISLAEPKRTINNGSGSNWEGNWMYKRNGIYYLHGAAGGGNYGMGASPYGPFTYKGKLIDGFDHPGIIEYKGQWYYFSQITDYTDTNGVSGADVRRNITIEYMYFNDDGTIKPIRRTKEGVSIPDSTPPSAPVGLSLSALNAHKVSLRWSAASDPETGISSYRVYRDGIMVGTTHTTSFTDSGLNESTTYSYQVSAANGGSYEGPVGSPATILTPTDIDPPVIASVNASKDVFVVFNEPIDQASAVNIANFALNGNITVSAAQLQADQRTVVLTVSAMARGTTYTLTVNNVRDRARTPNTIVPNSTAPFVFINNITKIRFYPRGGFEPRMLEGVFEGTNGDPINGPYALLYKISSTPLANQWSEVTNLTNSDVGYRYVRYRSASSSNVAEIELYMGASKASGTSFGSPGSWGNSGNDYTKAFDGDINTFFDYLSDVGGYTGLDLQDAAPGRSIGKQAGPERRRDGWTFADRKLRLQSAGLVTIFDAGGTAVMSRRVTSAGIIDTALLPAGVYAIRTVHGLRIACGTLVIAAR